jgi:hypothetical protein
MLYFFENHLIFPADCLLLRHFVSLNQISKIDIIAFMDCLKTFNFLNKKLFISFVYYSNG